MTAGVYKIQNTVNNKVYIGSSTHIEQRWIKKQRSELTRIGASDPERVTKRSTRMKDKWSNPEERQKQALASLNRKRIQHIETGMIYESILEACRLLPVSKQTIKNNLLGKFKSAKGMNFLYVEKKTTRI